jgi:hypothetical protein
VTTIAAWVYMFLYVCSFCSLSLLADGCLPSVEEHGSEEYFLYIISQQQLLLLLQQQKMWERRTDGRTQAADTCHLLYLRLSLAVSRQPASERASDCGRPSRSASTLSVFIHCRAAVDRMAAQICARDCVPCTASGASSAS